MNKKIIAYTLVDGGDLVNVARFVNELINEGFQPLGPISTAFVDHKNPDSQGFIRYTQTMVRYEG